VVKDRLTQTIRPDGRPQGFQRWQHLLFLHWELPAETIQKSLPSGLLVDTFEGRAFIGVVPFTMRDVAPWWSPSVPGVSNFHELNVRTYVHRDGRDPAVWFYSLDAASSLAVILARVFWHLPYHRASMRLVASGDQVSYSSRRAWPAPRPAELVARYEIGEPLGPSAPGTLEHFLCERYLLYAKHEDAFLIGQVHHKPYPVHSARVLELRESMVVAAGFPAPEGAPLAHYAPGVDVDVFALRKVD
jgi:uncharacterized protein YqjF (DUF2071 family)